MADAHDAIAEIEARLDALADAAGRSRKLALAGKAAALVGGPLALAALSGLFGLPPAALVFGLAAALGGVALAGTSAGSLDQTRAEIAALEAQRRALIDGIGLRLVDGGR